MRFSRPTSRPNAGQRGPVASVLRLPVDSAAASIVSMSLTRIGSLVEPRADARSRRRRARRRPAPRTRRRPSRPRCISAICVENIGYSRTNALVPSIGSTSQTYSASSALVPGLLAVEAVLREIARRGCARIVFSVSTSASVTGDLSALIVTGEVELVIVAHDLGGGVRGLECGGEEFGMAHVEADADQGLRAGTGGDRLTPPAPLPTVRAPTGDPARMARENGKPVEFRRCPRNGSRVEPASAGASPAPTAQTSREGDAGGTSARSTREPGDRPVGRDQPRGGRAAGFRAPSRLPAAPRPWLDTSQPGGRARGAASMRRSYRCFCPAPACVAAAAARRRMARRPARTTSWSPPRARPDARSRKCSRP